WNHSSPAIARARSRRAKSSPRSAFPCSQRARTLRPTKFASASIRISRPSSPPSGSSGGGGKAPGCGRGIVGRRGRPSWVRGAEGGLAGRAMGAGSIEGAVKGRPWAPAWLADVDALLARDFTPIADHRGGAAYRLRAAAGLLRRFQLETSLAEPMRVDAL